MAEPTAGHRSRQINARAGEELLSTYPNCERVLDTPPHSTPPVRGTSPGNGLEAEIPTPARRTYFALVTLKI